jgi:hypothetical protein
MGILLLEIGWLAFEEVVGRAGGQSHPPARPDRAGRVGFDPRPTAVRVGNLKGGDMKITTGLKAGPDDVAVWTGDNTGP